MAARTFIEKRLIKIIITFLFFLPVALYSQEVDDSLCIVNGTVETSVIADSILYIGGNFTSIGKYTGGLAALNTSNGRADSSFPKINGQVNSVIGDGNGGWFIGGLFDSAGGIQVKNLAHINPDKSIDISWKPETDGAVKILILSSDSKTLYVGGLFKHIDDSTRDYIAAINAESGKVSSWNPDANGTVTTLVVSDNDKTIFAGGYFTSIGDSARKYICGINSASGKANEWNPDADQPVDIITKFNNNIFAGGYFSSIGDSIRNCAAELDPVTGKVLEWNPDVRQPYVYGGAYVNSMALSADGKSIYIGGNFDSVGSASRRFVASVDAETGKVLSWNPGMEMGVVNDIAVSDSIVYLGGEFLSKAGNTTIGNSVRNYIAAVNAYTAQVTSWNPDANDAVNNILKSGDGKTIYAAGNFSLIGGNIRKFIASINIKTGRPTTWQPSIGGFSWGNSVNSMVLSPDNKTIYISGNFSIAGGSRRNYLAAFNTETGEVTSWNPGASSGNINLKISPDGKIIYAGGDFTSIGDSSRSNLAAIDAQTGEVTVWNPSPNNSINSFDISKDGKVIYLAGDFSVIGDSSRRGLAAASIATGEVLKWNPNPTGEYLIQMTSVDLSDDGNTVYTGGIFYKISGVNRRFLAALDASTGKALMWDPEPNQLVSGILSDGNIVYVLGTFNKIGGKDRIAVAVLNTSAGDAASWNPGLNFGFIKTMSLSPPNGKLYLGGKRLFINDHNAYTGLLAVSAADHITSVSNPKPKTIYPENFSLSQNYPNPFNPSTSIDYSLPEAQYVTIKVYNMLGKEIATLVNHYQNPGIHNVKFNADKFASGIYFYTFRAGEFVSAKKMVILK